MVVDELIDDEIQTFKFTTKPSKLLESNSHFKHNAKQEYNTHNNLNLKPLDLAIIHKTNIKGASGNTDDPNEPQPAAVSQVQ